ncbi:MAG: class F sortase [Actinomycetota bacterium]|nr:class F sortase [Actinomycetota bacterium]
MRLVVPAAGVEAPVVAELVSRAGSLGVPDDPAVLGWWAAGPEPGSVRGTAVIDGHVDSEGYGLGALFRLGHVTPGQTLAVTGTAGSEVFTVDAVRQFTKASLHSAGVFDQKVGGRLVVVTCGGPFDAATHTYRDNIVVYATPSPVTR